MRYVTNEQRRRRTLFRPSGWLIFCPAIAGLASYVQQQFCAGHRRRSVGVQNWFGMLVATTSPARTDLNIGGLTRQSPAEKVCLFQGQDISGMLISGT